MTDADVDALFICVAPGRFYGGREYPDDVKYESRTEPPIVPGDWVTLKMRTINGVQTVVSAGRSEPALQTIKYDKKIYLDVRVIFSKSDLYSEDMDDYIYLPQIADVDEFEFGTTYALLVTWMDQAERNYCTTKNMSGSKPRWKLAVNTRTDGSTVGLPTSRHGFSFLRQKSTMTLMGLIVGQDSNDKRRFYVWCPGCPLHYDGIVVEDPKCTLKIGKFILFKIDRREYNDVFVNREPRHFSIICYEKVDKPPCEVFVTNVTGDDRRSKNIIKMMVGNFTRRNSELQRVSDGNISGFIFTHSKILISDDKALLNRVPDGHMCNLMLIRQKPTEPWMTQWRVHEISSIKRPPPKRVVEAPSAINGITARLNRLSVETSDDSSAPVQVSRSKSEEIEVAVERRVESVASLTPIHSTPTPVAVTPTPSTPPSAPVTGPFDDLDIDEHIAFVEAYCNRNEAVYLWIIDDPQQAVIWGCKGKRKPLVGSFLRGYFKQQADGRLYCNMEDYEPCGAPPYIKVFDRSGHAIVRTDVLSEKNSRGEVLWRSRYLGLVEDVQRYLPPRVLDRERYTVQIGKRKQDKDFVWTIEMEVSKEQSHSSPSNGKTTLPMRKTSLLRSPSNKGNGVNGIIGVVHTSNGSSNGNGCSGNSSLNLTCDDIPLTPSEERSSSEIVTPPGLPSPGFDSRKTSVDEYEQHDEQYSLPPSRASGGADLSHNRNDTQDVDVDDDQLAPYYHVNDEEWSADTRQAREEPDPEMELIEIFANGFDGLFSNREVLEVFNSNMDPVRYDRLMQICGKY